MAPHPSCDRGVAGEPERGDALGRSGRAAERATSECRQAAVGARVGSAVGGFASLRLSLFRGAVFELWPRVFIQAHRAFSMSRLSGGLSTIAGVVGSSTDETLVARRGPGFRGNGPSLNT